MGMVKLTYTRASDRGVSVTVLGDPAGIADLYWQLTNNYSDITDGTGIGDIKVTTLDGDDVTDTFLHDRFGNTTRLSVNL